MISVSVVMCNLFLFSILCRRCFILKLVDVKLHNKILTPDCVFHIVEFSMLNFLKISFY